MSKQSREQLMLEWANIKDAVASPYYSGTLFNNISEEFIKNKKAIPGYSRVFGSLDFGRCDHSRSILGPAAYFVDLMRLVDERINHDEDGNPTATIPPGLSLEERRPDLADLRLDRDNTYSLIPYIDIVNEILEKLIEARDERDVYEVLAEQVHPEELPFNRYLRETRAYLEKLGTTLAEIYEAFGTAQLHVVRELLLLSPHELALVTRASRTPEELSRVDDFDVLESGIAGLENSANLMGRMGLSRSELGELLEQDLTPDEIAAGASRDFFVNDVDDGTSFMRFEKANQPIASPDGGEPTDVEYERITNLTLDKLDRMHRFVRLARKLEWSFADLDLALRSNYPRARREHALLFGDDQEFIRTERPAGIEISEGLTLEARVKTLRRGRTALLARTSASDPDTGYMLMLAQDGRAAFYHRREGKEEIHFSFSSVPLHEFAHVAAVIKGRAIAFYINGEIDRIVEKDFPLASTQDDVLLIGDTPPARIMDSLDASEETSRFLGFIKEVRLWTEARSPRVLRNAMDIRPGARTPGLAAYWPINEGHGRRIHDGTVNRNDAVFTGGVGGPTWHTAEYTPGNIPEELGTASVFLEGDFARATFSDRAFSATTLEMHVFIESAGTHPLLTRRDPETGASLTFMIDGSNRPALRLRGETDTTYTAPESAALPMRRFVHVALAIQNRTITFYVNGARVHEAAADAAPVFAGTEIILGGDGENAVPAGALREARIWNRARDEEEIRATMNHRLKGREPGLRACWPLDDACGAKARDLVGHAHLVFAGEKFRWIISEEHPIAGEIEIAALEFDGTNYASRENASHLAWSSLTVEAWVRTVSPGPNVVFSKGDEEGTTDFLLWIDEEGRPAFYHGRRGGATENVRARETVATGVFTHLAAVLHEDEITILVNGRTLTRTRLERTPDIRGEIINLGRSMEMERFRGVIRDVRVWNVPRTENEIRVGMYSPPSGGEGGLVGYWPVSEGEGTRVADRGPHGNHLELGGGDSQNNPEWRLANFARDTALPTTGFALRFDGEDDLVAADLSTTTETGERTIEFWFRPEKKSNAKQVLYHEGDAAAGLNVYLQGDVLYGGGWSIESRDDGDWAGTFPCADGLELDRWHHVALILNHSAGEEAEDFQLLLNGETRGSGKGGKLFKRAATVYLGSSPEAGRHHDGEGAEGGAFAGALKELRVWNRALSPGEVNAWMNIPVPSARREDLDLWLPCDEGSGARTADYSHRASEARLGNGQRGRHPAWVALDDNPLSFAQRAWRGERRDGSGITLPALKKAAKVTMETWLQPADTNGLQVLLGPAQGDGPAVFMRDNFLNVGSVSGSAAAFAHAFEATHWHHIALVFQGSVVRLLVNGRAREELNWKGRLLSGIAMRIGAGANGNAFRGLLRNFRLWSAALDEETILSRMYRRMRGGEGNLLGAWALNEGRGDIAYDVSPARNDGTYDAEPVLVQPAGPLAGIEVLGDADALRFDGRDDIVVLDEDCCSRCCDLDQHTVEIMFSPLCVSREKPALLYARGGEDSGLCIYIQAEKLRMTAWGRGDRGEKWRSEIETSAIRTRGNHHAALILDIADPCEPGELRGYLDGEIFGRAECRGVAVHGHVMTLGGPAHAGVLPSPCVEIDCFYQGLVTEFRAWHVPRGLDELIDYADIELNGREKDLMLLWGLRDVRGDVLRDASPHELHGKLGGGNYIARPRLIRIPRERRLGSEITNRTLANLAEIKEWRRTHDLSMEVLTSLWADMKHRGRAAKDPLFDLVFNGADFARERWDYFAPRARVWQIHGEDRENHAIRLRLRAALAVSDTDLTTIALRTRALDAMDNPRIAPRDTLELSSRNLTRMHRLSRTMRVLELNLDDFLKLLELAGPEHVRVQAEFSRLLDMAAKLHQLDLSVVEFAFLTNRGEGANDPIRDEDILVMAESVRDILPDTLWDEIAPPPSGLTPREARAAMNALRNADVVQGPGYINPDIASAKELLKLDFFRERNILDASRLENAAGPDLSESLLLELTDKLKSMEMLSAEGAIQDREFTDADLEPLFPALKGTAENSNSDEERDPSVIAAGRALAALKNMLNAPGALRRSLFESLIAKREEQFKLMRSALADFLGSEIRRVEAPAQYVHLNTMEFLEDMRALAEESAAMIKRNQEAVPSPRVRAYLERMRRLVFVADSFDLSIVEMELLLRKPDLFGIENPEYPSLEELTHLHGFRDLKKRHGDREDRFASYLQAPDFTSLASITSLPEIDIRETAAALQPARDVPALRGHEKIFDLIRATGMPAKLLATTAKTDDLSLTFYSERAEALLKILKSRYTEDEWEKNYEPIHETLAEARRDALTAALISDFRETRERPSADQLYELLLIDTQRAACWKTSRIQQAIASVQLYVQRVRMNLETGAEPGAVDDARWQWTKNYRVWEANRKVFLYPENYIEPDLRDTASPIFDQLKDELLQGEIDEKLAETVYKNYLDKFVELARLKIAGACVRPLVDPEGRDLRTLYLFGRTDTRPYIYYYRESLWEFREGEADPWKVSWEPWQKIDLTINSDVITPVFAYNRIFIFWVDIQEAKTQEYIGGELGFEKTEYRATIKYSYYTLNGSWVGEQILKEDFALRDGDEIIEPDQVFWRKVYAMTIQLDEKAGGDEKLIIMHGPLKKISKESLVSSAANISADQSRSILSEEDLSEAVTRLQAAADEMNRLAERARDAIEKFVDENGGLLLWGVRIGKWIADRVAADLNNSLRGLKARLQAQPGLMQGALGAAGETARATREGANTNLAFTLLDPDEPEASRTNANELFIRADDNLLGLTRVEKITGSLSARNEDIVNNIDAVVEFIEKKDPQSSEEEFEARIITQTANIHRDVIDLIAKMGEPRDIINDVNALADTIVKALKANQSKPREGFYPAAGAMALEQNLVRLDFGLGIQDAQSKRPSAAWLPARERELVIIGSSNPIVADYLGESPLYRELADIETAADERALLHGLSRKGASIGTIKNQPGWFSVDNSDAEYLMVIRAPLPPISRTLRAQDRTPDDSDQIALSFHASPTPDIAGAEFDVFRLNTAAVHELSGNLFAGGIDRLLSMESQLLAESDFARFRPEDGVHAPRKDSIDFEGPFGLYYREIFFHVPFLMATRLNANQKFEEARKWFHYIFDPTADEKTTTSNPADRYWRHLRFRERTPAAMDELLRDTEALREYHRDPFDPHAIARLRATAYPRAVVMKYIDNLLDHGDALFTRDTRESITEATLLYVMAYNLLGRRPEAGGRTDVDRALTYGIIREETDGEMEEFFTHLESELPAPSRVNEDGNPNHAITLQFCVMENEYFMQYWDRVEDRLFKIRHCMNIEGITRQLALFEPPIDPAALVRAFASGRDLSGVLTDLRAPVPHYRFAYLLEKTRSLAQTVTNFGSLLLSALEKKDGEELQALRNNHEKAVLDLTIKLKEEQRDEARESLNALKNALKGAQARLDHYSDLKGDGLIGEEIAQLVLQGVGVGLRTGSGIARTLAAAVAPAPNTGAVGPFPLFQIGGPQFGQAAAFAGEALAAGASALEGSASIVAAMGSFERREQDWDIQQKIATHDIAQIEKQITAAEARIAITEQDLLITRKQLEQNRDIDDFLRDKFTSAELYNWMITRMSSVYFQAYKLAYDWAKQSEKAFQYERITDDTHINFGHWDGLRKGLLAGEGLLLDINRLDKAYMRNYKRELEIERTISLAQLDPRALLELRRTGKCEFNLDEALFDYDFPGHYARRIKNLTISIPAVVGPYENIKATLTQLGNRVLLKPELSAAKYLLGAGDVEPDASVLRADWRPHQQIAVSTGVNDAGLFELNFRDERYLPFEGTGAVSNWRLEMPKAANRFDFESVADVIVRLRYMAYADEGPFREGVRKAMKNYSGHRILFMSREFSTAWHVFLNPPEGQARSLRVDMSEDIFPRNLENIKLESIFAAVLPGEDGSAAPLQFTVKAGNRTLGELNATESGILNPLNAGKFLGPWTLEPRDGNSLDASPPGDLVLVLRFQGKLDWGED